MDNPLFPLSALSPQLFEGEDRDPDTNEVIKTRVESVVLRDTDKVAGVEVTVAQAPPQATAVSQPTLGVSPYWESSRSPSELLWRGRGSVGVAKHLTLGSQFSGGEDLW